MLKIKMNRVFQLICVLAVGLVLHPQFTSCQEPVEMDTSQEIEQIIKEYQAAILVQAKAYNDSIDAMKARYVQALTTLEEGYKSAGNLKGVLAVRGERENFQATNSPGTGAAGRLGQLQAQAQVVMRQPIEANTQKVKAINDHFTGKLAQLQKSLTQAGKIEEAVQVNDFLEKIRTSAGQIGKKPKPKELHPDAVDPFARKLPVGSDRPKRKQEASASLEPLPMVKAGSHRDVLAEGAELLRELSPVVLTPGSRCYSGLDPEGKGKPVLFGRTRSMVGQISPLKISIHQLHVKSSGSAKRSLDGQGLKKFMVTSVRRVYRLLFESKLADPVNLRITYHYFAQADASPKLFKEENIDLKLPPGKAYIFDPFGETNERWETNKGESHQYAELAGNNGVIISIRDRAGKMLYQAASHDSLREFEPEQLFSVD